jgi:hypothetical protein
MASCKELGKNPRKQLNFTGGTNKLVIDETGRVDLVLDTVEQERVLADLAKLHELIAQAFDTAWFPIMGMQRVEKYD